MTVTDAPVSVVVVPAWVSAARTPSPVTRRLSLSPTRPFRLRLPRVTRKRPPSSSMALTVTVAELTPPSTWTRMSLLSATELSAVPV